ncbi:ADP-ribosylation factor GTPase-activating protein AGD1 isoform X1 [Arachis ipaensis]|uniref:ADP-ribosylation factor GTPase-activating protein AGD1 isoform X1 n=1 Tax=Arachis ipaensis TaxID=130454 RepID=UPI000A2B5036|nr:ADP-ribosylation factor GTPase-activating protein AGD1 isoform X1 [Arachis ipaensis]
MPLVSSLFSFDPITQQHQHPSSMYFAKLQDSPMFRQQLQTMEEGAESLRARCWRFYKGCKKYTDGLLDACDGDFTFASALENFGGEHSDPLFVTLGGPVMTKFSMALRDISTFKDALRTQVEQMLTDRLLHIYNVEIMDVKEARKRFDKASIAYDQAREKFMSLRKSTRQDIVIAIEEELHNARSSFEEARFNLISALHNVEAKKRFEFLEAVTGVMDAHLQYFRQGYELLHQLEPFIVEVLSYVQKARESHNEEQVSLFERMIEYKQLVHQESKLSLKGFYDSPGRDSPFSRISSDVLDAVTESVKTGKVQTIREGFLSKRSSNLRGDWKRRYFVLDSRGMLYYFRKPLTLFHGANSQKSHHTFDNSSGILSRLISSHIHGANDEKPVARHTVNLLTSTIKVDAEQTDLRFCFRIVSPSKVYTLQAENALDQRDWMEKITGVIASLLTIHTLGKPQPVISRSEGGDWDSASPTDSVQSSSDDEMAVNSGLACKITPKSNRSPNGLQKHKHSIKCEKPIDVLRRVNGNDKCADCGKSEPDWASLNLGILVCIECSGVHRNLGVHISKVRSLTLDVKVWDSSVLSMFQSLGNLFANSVWEELLHSKTSTDDTLDGSSKGTRTKLFHARKPAYDDPISLKERFIHAKYSEKVFVRRIPNNNRLRTVAQLVWESIFANDKKSVYRHIVRSSVDINALNLNGQFDGNSFATPSSSHSSMSSETESQLMEDIKDGSSVLHLACLVSDAGMVELLLQFRGKIATAKLLILRGANTHVVDKQGKTPLMLASEPSSEIVGLISSR